MDVLDLGVLAWWWGLVWALVVYVLVPAEAIRAGIRACRWRDAAPTALDAAAALAYVATVHVCALTLHGVSDGVAAVYLAVFVTLCLARRRPCRERVLLVADSVPPKVDGVTIFVCQAYAYLRARYAEVLVASGQVGSDAVPVTYLLPAAIPPHYPQHRLAFPLHWDLLADLVTRPPAVIVLFDFTPLSMATAALASILNIPTIWTHHTHIETSHMIVPWLSRAGLWPFLVKLVRLLLTPLATTHLPVSAYLQHQLAPLPLSKWPSGVSRDFYDGVPPAESAALRARWLAQGRTKVLLFVARLSSEKNWAALPALLAAHPSLAASARIVCIGDGPDRGRLEAALAPFGDAVLLEGEIVDRRALAACYAAADAFLLPSLSEAMPLVALEALAAGLPLFCLDEALLAEWPSHAYPWSAVAHDLPAKTDPLVYSWDQSMTVLASTIDALL
jgi:glycosyltransferase involved in cell wall biosynthesis